MEVNNLYTEIYDRIFFGLWDFTTGPGGSKKSIYKGAKLYGQFLLSEIGRYEEAKRSGAHAIERHGLVAPMSLIKAWAFNILEDCHQLRVVPPLELCQAIYYLMGCRHLTPTRGKPKTKEAYLKLIETDPNIGIREAARKLDVNPSTILRWQDNRSLTHYNWTDTHHEEFMRLREITCVTDYYPKR